MTKLRRALKPILLIVLAGLYISLFWAGLSRAAPTGASLSVINVDDGPTGSPSSRTDPGGTITTLNIDAVQQNSGWKAYMGNITGRLVLRNAQSQSIYEWNFADSALSGNVFISRSNAVNWTPIACANTGQIQTEDGSLGFVSSVSDSINKTFNYTIHRPMTISEIGTISSDTCRSSATYVNGTAQLMNSSTTRFQEILLSDQSSLVYATFIDQDSQGFDNNASQAITHDFQVIVADAKNATDYTYYFYADIS